MTIIPQNEIKDKNKVLFAYINAKKNLIKALSDDGFTSITLDEVNEKYPELYQTYLDACSNFGISEDFTAEFIKYIENKNKNTKGRK